MNHDITHCTGEGCANRNKCFRHKAHLEAVRLKLEYLSSYFTDIKTLKCYKEEL